jgi:hypothetical protein
LTLSLIAPAAAASFASLSACCFDQPRWLRDSYANLMLAECRPCEGMGKQQQQQLERQQQA